MGHSRRSLARAASLAVRGRGVNLTAPKPTAVAAIESGRGDAISGLCDVSTTNLMPLTGLVGDHRGQPRAGGFDARQ